MSVALDGNTVRLHGPSRVEDAEALLGCLAGHRGRSVDVAQAGHLHTAVWQVLMAFAPDIIGPPTDPLLARFLSANKSTGGAGGGDANGGDASGGAESGDDDVAPARRSRTGC